MNRSSELSVVPELEKLTNLFFLMVGVPLVAFAWIYLNLKTINPHDIFMVPAFRPYLHAGILLLSLAIAVLAVIQYRHRFTGLEPDTSEQEGVKESLNEKVQIFKEASLKKYVLFTISTLIIIGGFYLSSEETYGAAYSILLILYSINRPTPERLVKDMRLKKEERELVFKSVKESRYQQSNENK